MLRKKKKLAPKRKAGAGYVSLRESTNNFPIGIYTYGGREYPTPNGMPASVVVLGQHFEVRYHTSIFAAQKKKERLRGVVLFNFRLIVIDPRQSIHDLRETLYHEIAHVYLKAWQSRSVPLSNLTPSQVEEVCDMFAEGHYDANLNG